MLALGKTLEKRCCLRFCVRLLAGSKLGHAPIALDGLKQHGATVLPVRQPVFPVGERIGIGKKTLVRTAGYRS